VVVLLTWVVMPLITRALRGWLQAGESKTPMNNEQQDHFNLN
jgi:antibiotic biosynthesis monooxygenase (ABM) superfamily enzyme